MHQNINDYLFTLSLVLLWSESVVFPLPNEAMLHRSMFSLRPSNDVLSSNSLQKYNFLLVSFITNGYGQLCVENKKNGRRKVFFYGEKWYKVLVRSFWTILKEWNIDVSYQLLKCTAKVVRGSNAKQMYP